MQQLSLSSSTDFKACNGTATHVRKSGACGLLLWLLESACWCELLGTGASLHAYSHQRCFLQVKQDGILCKQKLSGNLTFGLLALLPT